MVVLPPTFWVPAASLWASFPRKEEQESKAKREWPGPYFEPAYDLWRLRPRKMETTEATEPPLNQSQDAQQADQPLGTETDRGSRPVLTRQGVMDLVSKDAETLTPGSGWELTKQGYCGLLSGYESPNGSTVNVAIDLAALIIMSAVSESTIKNGLQMQQAANEKLLRQAEEHRILTQKQFTEGMARMC